MVRSSPYQPDRGDLVYLHFSPHAGTEQGGRRPALVLSPRAFNIATSLAFVCPLTSRVKNSPFEVPLPQGSRLGGVVLADHVRSLDWIERKAEFHSKASEDLLEEVVARISAVLMAT